MGRLCEKKKTLNLLIITQGLSLIVDPLVNSQYKVLGIIEDPPRVQEKKSKLFTTLQEIYRQIKRQHTLEQYAAMKHIPYMLLDKAQYVPIADKVKKLHPDLIVVYSMSHLLKEDIFSIPVHGTINIHPTFLPKYRGPNPFFWMRYNQDLCPGVTVHYINQGEDTGDIICQDSYDISMGISEKERQSMQDTLALSLLFKALELIRQDNVIRIKQPAVSPTPRARLLHESEYEKLIDWALWPVERVWHFLCGEGDCLKVLPKPAGLYFGQQWNIGKFEHCDMHAYSPGKIYGHYFLACVDGKIYLSIQFSIKRAVRNLIG